MNSVDIDVTVSTCCVWRSLNTLSCFCNWSTCMGFDQEGKASVYRYIYLTFSPSSGLSALIVIANSAMAAVSAFWSPAIVLFVCFVSLLKIFIPLWQPRHSNFWEVGVQLLRLRPLHWIGIILLTSNPLQGVVEGSNLFICLQSVRKVYARLGEQKAV